MFHSNNRWQQKIHRGCLSAVLCRITCQFLMHQSFSLHHILKLFLQFMDVRRNKIKGNQFYVQKKLTQYGIVSNVVCASYYCCYLDVWYLRLSEVTTGLNYLSRTFIEKCTRSNGGHRITREDAQRRTSKAQW